MNTIKKSISVILPNYNGKHLIELYIPSVLEALSFSEIDYEFIIIDDCSTDNSVEFIQENYPSFNLQVNQQNKGFSFTCNKGIAIAKKELLFILNSDVKLTPNYFENQMKYFEFHDTFGVMGQIKNFDGKKIEDTARFPKFKGAKFKATTFFYSENVSDKIYTTYLSGANALINREKLQFLNGFNEIYSPFYFEDFDLGLRAWKMGWKSYYEHKSICFHRVSASTGKLNQSNFVKIIYYRNSFILHAIHLKGFRKIIWYSQLYTSTLLWHLIKREFWIFNSLEGFIEKRIDIKKSILTIETAQKGLGVTINVNDIIKIFKKSLKNKNIIWK